MKYLIKAIVASLISITIFSCSQKIVPGKYVYSVDKSFIQLDDSGNYFYSTSGYVHGVLMFSKGKYEFKEREIKFIPDSSFFFHISVLKYYFDSTIENNRKIVLRVPDSLLVKYHFSFSDGSANSGVKFPSNGIVVYKPADTLQQEGIMILKAKLNDSYVILPRLFRDSIASNYIDISDVYNEDSNAKPWNVVELNVHISRDMFAFTTLKPHIFKNRRLLPKDIPIYELLR